VAVGATFIAIATGIEIEIEIETVVADETATTTVTLELETALGAEDLVLVHVRHRIHHRPMANKVLVLLQSNRRLTEQRHRLPQHPLHLPLKTKNSKLSAHALRHGKKSKARRKLSVKPRQRLLPLQLEKWPLPQLVSILANHAG
jgi:hypothetical protein